MKKLVVTFFYTGFVPGLPGTASAFVTMLLTGLYFSYCSDPRPLVALIVAMFFAGLGLGRWAIAHFDNDDPKQFVLDEACGQLIAGLAATTVLQFAPNAWLDLTRSAGLPEWADKWLVLSAAFVLFRFFDIVKPPPIRQLERLPGGLGIMADDVAAGLAALVILVAGGAAYAHYVV